MKPWPKERLRGRQAYGMGIPKEKNPYNMISYKQHGPQKAASWAAGWDEARKEDESND